MGNTQTKPTAFSDQAVNLNQFRLLRVVGKGAFGKVRIVERKDTGLAFALKYIIKEEVVRSESVRNIIRERRMLEHLNHPFLCNLRYSFQDIEYIYIVVDLMTGGDLRFHISRKCFTEDAVRFWIAELGCALRYIHSQGIIHRDVKPDNVLLDNEGHVHLADFNVASDYRPNKKLTSKSGTMAYLAPEVYEGRGYLTEVDWWSLGVTFYECIYNKRPFDGRTHDQLSGNIRRAQPKYYVTNPAVTIPCLHAIGGLLEKDINKRIGASSWTSFITHPFFADIDFGKLVRKEINPIFRPSSEKTNFDATYDLEELLLEEAPLEARARRQKPRAELKDDATAKEIREDGLHKMLETLFEPFDYTKVGFDNNVPAATVSPDAAPNGANLADSTPRSSSQPQVASIPINDPTSTTYTANGGCASLAQTPLSRSHPDPTNPLTCPDLTDNNASTSRPFSNPQSYTDLQPSSTVDKAMYAQAIHPAFNPPTRPPPPIPSGFSGPPPHPNPNAGAYGAPTQPFSPAPGAGSRKFASRAGGVQMILDETGSWSNLADSGTPSPDPDFQGTGKANGRGSSGSSGPSGMFSFLTRKRGRDRSPKPTEPGVLGKEGARQIIS